MRTIPAAAPLAGVVGLTLVFVVAATSPSVGAPRLIRAQSAEMPLYQCVDGTEVDVAIVGLALCDAEPTPPLHERAEPDNLQIRDGALVVEVDEGGHAAREGVQTGDMIYRVAGADVAGAAVAGERLAGVASDSDTLINFLRRGRPYRIKLRR